jgi:hypothetical protein
MKPGKNRDDWLGRASGLVLALALAWSGWVARSEAGPLVGRPSLTAVPSAAPDLAWFNRETLEEGPRRGWTASVDERRGLFDRPGTGVPPAVAVSRRRRRDVELVATRELPYRLQLIGHFGEGANLSGIFEVDGNVGPWLARTGDELPGLGVIVQDLFLGPGDDETPPRLVARIWDRQAERPLELPESVRVPSGTGAAWIAPAGYPGEAIELRVGEVVEVDGSEFRVESIRVSPAAVRLRRLAAVEPEDAIEDLSLETGEEES